MNEFRKVTGDIDIINFEYQQGFCFVTFEYKGCRRNGLLCSQANRHHVSTGSMIRNDLVLHFFTPDQERLLTHFKECTP